MKNYFETVYKSFEKLNRIRKGSNFMQNQIDDFHKKQHELFFGGLEEFYFSRITKSNIHKNKSLFRITKEYDSLIGKKVKEFYNPPPALSSLERCNYPYYPVLYLSSSPFGALIETVKEEDLKTNGTNYYLSEWYLDE